LANAEERLRADRPVGGPLGGQSILVPRQGRGAGATLPAPDALDDVPTHHGGTPARGHAATAGYHEDLARAAQLLWKPVGRTGQRSLSGSSLNRKSFGAG